MENNSSESIHKVISSLKDVKKIYDDTLLNISSQNYITMPNNNKIKNIGKLIDSSYYLKDGEDGFKKAIELGKELLSDGNLSSKQLFLLYYYMGNAESDLFNFTLLKLTKGNKDMLWEKHEELENSIIYYRKALNISNSNHINEDIIKCQILVNLANIFNTTGRTIEAIDYLNQALQINPNFGMALGNLGVDLLYYSEILHDSGHKNVFNKYGYINLINSLNDMSLDTESREAFNKIASNVKNMYLENYLRDKDTHMDKFYDYDGDYDKKYRKWVSKNTLYLNPLNDLFARSIVENDVITLPPMSTRNYTKPYFHGLFNQIKQEFATARYLYYEGVSSENTHFSDYGVKLTDTFDYTLYSYNIERVKIAYRMAYSILDKIAYFLYLYYYDEFLENNVKNRSIDFRTLWYTNNKKKKDVRSFFKLSLNRCIYALYWVSKDIYNMNLKNPEDYSSCLEPDAKKLNELRNALEHRYIRINEYGIDIKRKPEEEPPNIAKDISREELEAKTLKILKIVRASIMYLNLAVHIEEGKRFDNEKENIELPMYLSDVEDSWKK